MIKKDMITGETLADGDVLIGMASTGVHSMDFHWFVKSFTMDKETLDTYHEELGTTLGEAFLAPTRIYVKTACHQKCRHPCKKPAAISQVVVSMKMFQYASGRKTCSD